MIRLVILGAVGAGKTTQAHRLAARYGIPAIAMGELLRAEVSANTALGERARPFLEAGKLIPDELAIAFMRARLQAPDTGHGWLLEGYPRTAFQAEELDFLLDDLGCPLDRAIYLRVPDDMLMARSLARGGCDDTPDLIRTRLQEFADRTTPLLDYYDYKGRLLTVDGAGTVEDITAAILDLLGR